MSGRETLIESLRRRTPIGTLLTSTAAVYAASPDAILLAPEERDALVGIAEAAYRLATVQVGESSEPFWEAFNAMCEAIDDV